MDSQLASEVETRPIIATRAQFVAECRKLLGARWQHQGRMENGVDCVGLLVVPALRLGILKVGDDKSDYQRNAQNDRLDCLLHYHCRRLPDWREARPADVLAIKYKEHLQHVMVVTQAHDPRWGFHIIHSFGSTEMGGGVVEHRLDDVWLKSHRARIHAAFQIRGVG